MSNTSPKVKKEFDSIYGEFKKKNPTKKAEEFKGYWKALYNALKVKHLPKKDFNLEKEVYKELKLAIIRS